MVKKFYRLFFIKLLSSNISNLISIRSRIFKAFHFECIRWGIWISSGRPCNPMGWYGQTNQAYQTRWKSHKYCSLLSKSDWKPERTSIWFQVSSRFQGPLTYYNSISRSKTRFRHNCEVKAYFNLRLYYPSLNDRHLFFHLFLFNFAVVTIS